ncbi:GMC family oxidoreductase [Alcaligenaceae bacterium CGII-47]|nr:GMC family oxidoreductase [Alcaligenaceae bacterium CGII-47]
MTSHLTADVVIIGSGVAGALVAAKLAESGVRVCIMEAGQAVNRAEAVQTFWKALIKVPECAYPSVPQAMHPVSDNLTQWYCQSGPNHFKSTYLKVVGGTTWHWLGTCLRLIPSDFETKTRFGWGVDWPISYAALEPFYLQAEQEIGVSGDSDQDLGSPRSGDYPMPRIPPTYVDQTFSQALQDSPYQVRSTPQARNSVFRDQRIACCGSASCIPVCPVQAKYDATVHIGKALAAGATLLERSTAVNLQLGPEGEIDAVRFRRWDNTEGEIRAKIFVLACNAIETPRLLLASQSAAHPQGLANRSDQVGRNLMDHPVQLSWALSGKAVYPYRGPLSTSGIENLRDGEFRRERSAFRIEIGNEGWNWPTGAPTTTAADLANTGLQGSEMKAAMANAATHHVRLGSLMEQEPDPENRVTLDATQRDMYGVPLPNLNYRISDYVKHGLEQARQAHTDIFKRLNSTQINHAPEFFGAGHIMGTTRMGSDPKTSVVDESLRSHDHHNLFMVGAGVFPTTGTANPTLTIAALSLRAAGAIRDSLLALPSAT